MTKECYQLRFLGSSLKTFFISCSLSSKCESLNYMLQVHYIVCSTQYTKTHSWLCIFIHMNVLIYNYWLAAFCGCMEVNFCIHCMHMALMTHVMTNKRCRKLFTYLCSTWLLQYIRVSSEDAVHYWASRKFGQIRQLKTQRLCKDLLLIITKHRWISV